MSDLYPTKTRLDLLWAIYDGAVVEKYPLLPAKPYSVWDDIEREPRLVRVTARVKELERAGWIVRGDRAIDSWHGDRFWKVTAAGVAVLKAATP